MDMAYSEGGDRNDHTDFVGYSVLMGSWRLISKPLFFRTPNNDYNERSGDSYE